MTRRGRPKGGDSAETRQRIIDAARIEFAQRGFDGASIATISTSAELAPSAVYHYFGGKAALYETVFEETAEAIWQDVDASAAANHDTLLESISSLVISTGELKHTRPHYSDFLALVPMEATLHREFAYLLDRRSKNQDATFGSLAELGVATGELDGFTLIEATEMLRALIMGWFIETHVRGVGIPGSAASLIKLIRLLGERDLAP